MNQNEFKLGKPTVTYNKTLYSFEIIYKKPVTEEHCLVTHEHGFRVEFGQVEQISDVLIESKAILVSTVGQLLKHIVFTEFAYSNEYAYVHRSYYSITPERGEFSRMYQAPRKQNEPKSSVHKISMLGRGRLEARGMVCRCG